MDEESYEVIEEILKDDEESRRINFTSFVKKPDHEWKTVSYRRRRNNLPENFDGSDSGEVFRPMEMDTLKEVGGDADVAVVADVAVSDMTVAADVSVAADVAKRRVKKTKVNVCDVAAKMDASDLAAFLADITVSYGDQEEILLRRFVDYFVRVFSKVTSSQFPWMKLIKESSVANMIDIPVSHISEDVYKTSIEWLKQRSSEALGTFVLWLWDIILADLEIHQGSAKGPKKAVQQGSKTQVAIFVVLAMTLREKPEVLANLVPKLREETSRYVLGLEKLPVTVWVISQACQGDLCVGLFIWVNLLLPMLNTKPSCPPQSRDLILQLVERILASPKAGRILLNGVVKKGERLVPPAALEQLVRLTFPASLSRIKATERFEAVYPTLKEVALAGPPGSKVMKQITLFAVKAAGERVPQLSNEAINLGVWCLTHHPESYRQWDGLYLDNLEASVRVLKKLVNEWENYSTKVTSVEPLKATLISFKKKNEKAMRVEENEVRLAVLKDAEKLRKLLMARLTKSHTCIKGTVFVSAALAVCATAAVVMSHDSNSWDLKKFVGGFI